MENTKATHKTVYKVDSLPLEADKNSKQGWKGRFDTLDDAHDFADLNNRLHRLKGFPTREFEIRKITTICELIPKRD